VARYLSRPSRGFPANDLHFFHAGAVRRSWKLLAAFVALCVLLLLIYAGASVFTLALMDCDTDSETELCEVAMTLAITVLVFTRLFCCGVRLCGGVGGEVLQKRQWPMIRESEVRQVFAIPPQLIAEGDRFVNICQPGPSPLRPMSVDKPL
jgi:cytochrome bd-type quinol oxidase subunit 2